MDEIFGEKNFINEVIWNYKSGGVSNRHFARKHDTLLYYAKSKEYYFKVQKEKSYNRGYKPYRFKGVKEYKDELGWYTMVNKKDVWQIDMVGRTSAERTGYATQKPELLIEQILESCTQEGDLCADFFAGSGTLAAVAERMGRRWLCCDAGVLAVAGSKRRLAKQGAAFSCYYPVDSTDFFTGNGKVSADVALQDNATSDTMVLSVSLTGYELSSLSTLPIGEQQLKAVKKILKKDPLSLVDFWTVDFHFDGKIFHPELFLFREKDRLTVRGEVLVKEIPAKKALLEKAQPEEAPNEEAFSVGIKVYDVFGGCGFLTVNVDV